MRLAMCSDSFLPVVDGVGRVVYQYADALGKAGHEVYVICPQTDMGYRGGFPFEVVDYAGMPMPGSPQYRAGMPILDTHYGSRIGKAPLDLVHAHTPGPAGFEALRLANKRNVPLVGTFHSRYYDDFYRVLKNEEIASLGARMVAEFYSRCDEVWTVSRSAADALRSYGYDGQVIVVPNGTDPRPVRPADRDRAVAALGLGPEPVLLYVGQLDWKKNLRCVVEAAGLLQSRGLSFQLVLAGQGRDQDAVRALADERGISDRLTLPGHIADAALLYGLYAAAALFLFPSLYDTAGLVVMEAAAMQTPSVVVSGSAPGERIVDGENGFVCDDSPESLANAVERALSEPTLLERVGRAAGGTLPLPWERVMRQVTQRYQALLQQPRGQKRRLKR